MKENLGRTIVNTVNEFISAKEPAFVFGENINTGSQISGLARGITTTGSSVVRNVANCELTHCGVGLGLMLDGGSSVLFVKQLDFLLLGLDQICNTFNFARSFRKRQDLGSFTIITFVCDQGFQGPQSSLNNLSDFSSLANIPVLCINSMNDASSLLAGQLSSPGFRIVGVSQQQFGQEIIAKKPIWQSGDGSIVQYCEGTDVTIVSYNFSLRQSFQLQEVLQKNQLNADLFFSNFVPGMSVEKLSSSVKKTGKLVIVDDSKSVAKQSDVLSSSILSLGLSPKVFQCTRDPLTDSEYGASPDVLDISHDKVIDFVSQ